MHSCENKPGLTANAWNESGTPKGSPLPGNYFVGDFMELSLEASLNVLNSALNLFISWNKSAVYEYFNFRIGVQSRVSKSWIQP